MQEYSSSDARIDIERFLSDCLFMVRIDYSVENIVWILVTALNKKDAEDMVVKNLNLKDTKVTAFQTLNAIESTIK